MDARWTRNVSQQIAEKLNTQLFKSIPGGLVDAGFASLATFCVGVFSASVLDVTLLGAYALYFSAFLMAATIPTQLFFVPAEVWVVSTHTAGRLGVLRHTLRTGTVLALGASALVSLAAVAVPSGIQITWIVALNVTAAACAFLSPIQDHVRRVLHLADQAWGAAFVSLVQVLGVLAGLGLLTLWQVPPPWVPFGVLAFANAASSTVGFGLIAVSSHGPLQTQFSIWELMRSGRWLLLQGLIPAGAGFLCAAVVAQLAGVGALGFAEAARIVGQPVLVLAAGISAATGPLIMAAAARKQQREVERTSRVVLLVTSLVGAAYLCFFGFEHAWNPLPGVVPTAFVIPGLVVAAVIATSMEALTFAPRAELMGAGQQRKLAEVEAIGNVVRTAFACGAVLLRSFALPCGMLALAWIRWLGYRRARRLLYGASVSGAQAASKHRAQT